MNSIRNTIAGMVLGAAVVAITGLDVKWPSLPRPSSPRALHPVPWHTKAASQGEVAEGETKERAEGPTESKILTDSNAIARANEENTPGLSVVRQLNKAFTTLAARVSPAVVNIYTKSGVKRDLRRPGPQFPGLPEDDFEFFFGAPFGEMPGVQIPRAALGSGFVINAKQGYVVTNAHVVRMAGKDADEILVKFSGEENEKGHLAKIVGADEVSDVALLKLVDANESLKDVPLGDSDKSQVGEWVVAIGNPYGHTNTVTQGIISAVGRNLEGARTDFMQTSAGINPGNSGGPLVNMDGEVVGINTAIDPRAQNIGFAIPINTAKKVVVQLAERGKVIRPWLGVAIRDVPEDLAAYLKLKSAEGVLVKDVMPGQPAAKAGLQPFDVITKVNDNEVKNVKDLYRSLDKLEAGKSATLEVLRNNRSRQVKVEMGEQPTPS
ncbi:MAG: trypsin-like peptidase domain-containing protein [Bdellovibrionales bacterium]